MLPDNLLIEDFANCDWQAVLASASAPTCEEYRDRLANAYKQCVANGDEPGGRALGILSAVTSFHLRPRNAYEPFSAMLVLPDGRSPIPDDLTEAQLGVLRELLPQIQDPELAARCSDVLWLRERDAEAARTAIDAYVASADAMFSETEWLASLRRYERATRIAVFLGREKQQFVDVTARVRALALACDGECAVGLPCQLMRLLLEFSRDQPEGLLQVALRFAERSRDEGNTILERKYLRQASAWATEAGDEEMARASRVQIAESFVREADARLEARAEPDGLVAAGLVRKAILEYRAIGDSEEQIAELSARLPHVQFDALGQLGLIQVDIDGRELAETAVAQVSLESWIGALTQLVLLSASPSYDDLENGVLQELANSPFLYLSSAQILDEEGRLVVMVPPLGTAEGDDRQLALEVAMCRRAALDRHITFILIHAARRQILKDHFITEQQIVDLIEPSPIVLWGQERLFGRGLYAGLTGDFVTAGHLLVTQLERAIRLILASKGAAFSSLLPDGTQKARSLDGMLSSEEALAFFGKDLLFDLRDLLVLPYGANLRNRIAHGLLHQGQFQSGEFHYLWWLCLRLCLLPLIEQPERGEVGDKPATATAEEE